MLAFQGINLNSEMRGDIQQMSPDEKLYVNEIFIYILVHLYDFEKTIN